MRVRARRRQPSRAASGLPWREKRASCRDPDRIGSAEREHLAAAIEYEADLHLRAAPARRDHPVQPEDLGADRRRDERPPAAGRRAALEVDHAAEDRDRHHPAEREVVAGANHGWEAHEGHRAWGWERDARPRGGVHAATARPGVSFPSPGAMTFVGLPAVIRPGHDFTLRGVMPIAIFGGVIHLQRRTPAGGWRTLVSAAVRPKVFWLHWMVPARWRGTQMEVRFVLDSGGQMLALSAPYSIGVS